MIDNRITLQGNHTGTKICITCNKELPLAEYSVRRYRSSKPDAHWIYSRYGECKECTSKRKLLWRTMHPNYMKAWYIKNRHNNDNKCHEHSYEYIMNN